VQLIVDHPLHHIIMPRLFSTLLVLASALLVHAGIDQTDFTGTGHIHVLKSDNWPTATPESKVGCLDDHGKLVSGDSKCGTFTRLNDYPYTLSTKHGNCTFKDETQERNTDSHYGTNDYAWSCQEDLNTDVYDQLYTVVSLACNRYANHKTDILRTASHTSSFVSAMLHATTTPRRCPQRTTCYHSGSFAGARSRWASRQVMFSYC
jgi:hypothetical protein